MCIGLAVDCFGIHALVVHGAWYGSERMISDAGMLGRSQRCLAVADSSLPEIMAQLGTGRLIYAGKTQRRVEELDSSTTHGSPAALRASG